MVVVVVVVVVVGLREPPRAHQLTHAATCARWRPWAAAGCYGRRRYWWVANHQNGGGDRTGNFIPLVQAWSMGGSVMYSNDTCTSSVSVQRAVHHKGVMAVNSISFGSPHVRCTPMGVHRTCGEPNEIKKNTRTRS